MPDRSRKNHAEAQFKKLQRADDAKAAMSEYEAERAAVHAKTVRLRALRLARDAALVAAEQAAPKPPAAKKKPKAAKAK